ncbi:MAG: STAS domain-containing protein [Leptospirales bacterium]|nr:STAS domain-containing protein [Leptospirales bacterium]
MELEITTKIEDEYILLAVKSVLSIETINSLEALLSKYVKEKKHILIDLSGITFIDSSSLGILVKINTQLEKNNRRLLLLNISSHIMKIFESTELDKHIRIFDDITSACNALGLN